MTLDLSLWTRQVNQLLLADYGITIDRDAGLTDEELANHFEREPEPSAFVQWFALKYDLTSRIEWNAFR